jgi:hypothetical protein
LGKFPVIYREEFLEKGLNIPPIFPEILEKSTGIFPYIFELGKGSVGIFCLPKKV